MAQPQPFSLRWLPQMLDKHATQALLINLSVFKGFVQATPAPFKGESDNSAVV